MASSFSSERFRDIPRMISDPCRAFPDVGVTTSNSAGIQWFCSSRLHCNQRGAGGLQTSGTACPFFMREAWLRCSPFALQPRQTRPCYAYRSAWPMSENNLADSIPPIQPRHLAEIQLASAPVYSAFRSRIQQVSVICVSSSLCPSQAREKHHGAKNRKWLSSVN
jgi:hypothetical protein